MVAAIRVENLGKCYRVAQGKERGGYRTLRESLVNALTAPFRGRGGGDTEPFWALEDISFEVQPGAVVGIIGRNGAGKSTLLKILSRITGPTTGGVEINDRVGSLLEVGTGFHQELTGRENVYLNGSILGMRRSEIQRRFDEIVAFAEIDRFLDTPVKRYSSGMYVRLAFAVAAHMSPEILVVDEVLAVGDAQFQQKCLGKMREVSGEGRTVLFVSHNISALTRLCGRGVLLERGRVKSVGGIAEVVADYLAHESQQAGAEVNLEHESSRRGTGEIRILRLRLLDQEGKLCTAIRLGQSLTVEVDMTGQAPLGALVAGLHVVRFDGLPVLDVRSDRQNCLFQAGPECVTIRCTIPAVPLYPGRYTIEPWVGRAGSIHHEVCDYVCGSVSFEVLPPENAPFGKFEWNFGVIHWPTQWSSSQSQRCVP